MMETSAKTIEFSEPEMIGTLAWQLALFEALNGHTGNGEPTLFYEIDRLFEGMYSPKWRLVAGQPAFILSSKPMTEQEQIQLVARQEDLIDNIMRSIENQNTGVGSVKKKFIGAGIELRSMDR